VKEWKENAPEKIQNTKENLKEYWQKRKTKNSSDTDDES